MTPYCSFFEQKFPCLSYGQICPKLNLFQLGQKCPGSANGQKCLIASLFALRSKKSVAGDQKRFPDLESKNDTSFSSRSFSSRLHAGSRWCCPIGGSAVRRFICYWYCNSTSNSISNSYFCYRLFWFVIACYNTDNIVIICYRLL